ncbi:MAG TPA: adenylate/guanylate cyclase domain-containing protein [Gaiellaceae bacterium]|nr:adenylate/guanylate cyclase domain-containing protein [Gaiellaceae bacterium]
MATLARKTVTVLFADVVGSTPFTEERDPEAVRAVMSRYFDRMSAVIGRHGGTVEKYIGDAIMAVFGIPSAHEDDALRAVRAAAEMRVALAELNAGLSDAISIRVGLNTGEVVVGDGHTLVTGDAVNVAARLEQSALPGEIRVGETTHTLVRDAVVAEPVGPLDLKGKAQPTQAWRVLAVVPDAPGRTRRFDTPLVGRSDELAMLRQAYARAAARRACHLFTLLGPAGVGKSRLAREFTTEVAVEARVVVGRCLPYGDGITYWPLRDIVRSLGPVAGLREGDTAVIDAALGEGRAAAGPEETAGAFRRVVEAAARERPLVLGFEDIHWAEPALLALIEHVADGVRDAPILLLCLARPELYDEHPSWGGGKPNATTILLEPLDAAVSEALVHELGGDAIAADMRRMITEVAEGNPLFLEEIVAMVVDEGAAPVAPPSVQALLTARLELLSDAERAALAAAAVAGRFFSRDALAVLGGDEALQALPSLERKDLVRPHETRLSDAGYRFRHILIRDAAYDSLPKARRADLHVRLADLLAETATAETRREADELGAWHLEQAYEARRQVGIADDELGRRAFAALARLGRAALDRSDAAAGESLLQRALAIELPLDADRVAVRFELVPALLERAELARADAVAARVAEEAAELGDPVLLARAEIERLYVDFAVRPSRWVETASSSARAALPTLEAAGDDAAIARAWLVIVTYDYVRGRVRDMEAALDNALRHARRGGDRYVADLLVLAVRSLVFGPQPVDEALRRCDEIAAEGGDESVVHGIRAALHAMAGRFDEARAAYRAGHALLEEHGRTRLLAVQRAYAGVVEQLAGDPAAAERELRASARVLDAIGDRATLSTIGALLATALHARGRDGEARTWAARSRDDAPTIDLTSQVQWRTALASVSADVALAHEAVAIAEGTEATPLHADALLCLRELLAAAGRREEADAAARRAAELYRAKGHLVGVQRAAAAPARSGGT